MNFTFTLRKPPDGQWGSLMKNGTWTGMVKELQRKKADIGKINMLIVEFKIQAYCIQYYTFLNLI